MLSQLLYFPTINVSVGILYLSLFTWYAFMPFAYHFPLGWVCQAPSTVEFIVLKLSLVLSSVVIS